MPHSDVENHVSESKSEKRCESWSTVPGMRSYHMYVPNSISTLEILFQCHKYNPEESS